MTAEAHIARQVAMNFEAKKHELRQLQDGHWKITLTIHPNDMPDEMMKAPMGTRYMVAACEIGDDQAPVQHEENVKEKRKWPDLDPRVQAAIRCGEPLFQTWLSESVANGRHIDELRASDIVRQACNISSRSELSTNEKARSIWRTMDHDFLVWKDTPDL